HLHVGAERRVGEPLDAVLDAVARQARVERDDEHADREQRVPHPLRDPPQRLGDARDAPLHPGVSFFLPGFSAGACSYVDTVISISRSSCLSSRVRMLSCVTTTRFAPVSILRMNFVSCSRVTFLMRSSTARSM